MLYAQLNDFTFPAFKPYSSVMPCVSILVFLLLSYPEQPPGLTVCWRFSVRQKIVGLLWFTDVFVLCFENGWQNYHTQMVSWNAGLSFYQLPDLKGLTACLVRFHFRDKVEHLRIFLFRSSRCSQVSLYSENKWLSNKNWAWVSFVKATGKFGLYRLLRYIY